MKGTVLVDPPGGGTPQPGVAPVLRELPERLSSSLERVQAEVRAVEVKMGFVEDVSKELKALDGLIVCAAPESKLTSWRWGRG